MAVTAETTKEAAMNNIDSGLTEHNSGTANQSVGVSANEKAVDGLPATAYAPLRFDAAEFMQFVDDEDLTPAQAEELLRVTWEIMVGFVDIAFGISPTQQIVDRLPSDSKRRPRHSRDVISSSATISTNPKELTLARDNHREAGGSEDS